MPQMQGGMSALESSGEEPLKTSRLPVLGQVRSGR